MDQETQERIERLENGCCPIHGQFMSQIDNWYEDENGKDFTIVGCSRNACLIIAKAYLFDGPWELPPEFISLLVSSDDDPIYLDEAVKPNKSKKNLKRYCTDVLKKTNGFCYYCGSNISEKEMAIDHFIPEAKGGVTETDNLFPSCKFCNSSKGIKDSEEFRFSLQMKIFKDVNGVSFTKEQIAYLSKTGHDVPIPSYVFWYEKIKSLK